jgi:hypothetical protein
MSNTRNAPAPRPLNRSEVIDSNASRRFDYIQRLSWMQPKRSGNSGRYFMVRNWLSEYGLSSET